MQIGDQVLIYRKSLKDKFAKNWIQGFKITAKIQPDAYIVQKGKSTLRCNKSQVKLDLSQIREGGVATVLLSSDAVARIDQNF